MGRVILAVVVLCAGSSLAVSRADDLLGDDLQVDDAPTSVEPRHPLADHPLYDGVLPFRTTELAAEPTDGGMRPSRGYPHYDLPSRHYGLWFRPASFGRGPAERCTPATFNPRGYGRLFVRSSTGNRMDYDPHVLRQPWTPYGPAYLVNPVDYRCRRKLCSKCGDLLKCGGPFGCGDVDGHRCAGDPGIGGHCSECE